MRDIRPLIAPRSIAVIGASTNSQKSGGVLFSNLLNGGFKGSLYPINPGSPAVMGERAYAQLRDVPESVDLVYIVLPSQHMEAALQQCIEAKARAACIITAGFAEAGPAGRVAQAKLRDAARKAGILLAGPNTIGMVNAECGMMGSFVNFPRWHAGGISLFTQTGIFTGALMRQMMDSPVQRLAISKSIDVGNKIDVDEVDFLDFAARDLNTKTIGLYIESIGDPDAFFERVNALRGVKPIVLLKPGRTAAGKAASACHTGSPAVDDIRIDDRIRAGGILRADDEDDFINALRAVSMLPKAQGRRIAIATTSGALGVIASDHIADHGFELATFAPETVRGMRAIYPDWLEPANPFDFWIGIDIKGAKDAHEIGLHAVFADPNVDLALCTLLAPPNADFPEMGDLLKTLRTRYGKPFVLVAYGSAATRWTADVEGADIPVYATVRAGVRALACLVP
ncbi:MAG: CoA-binding protein [Methylobacteriaceae bacterium]|nr:CoA-binding protein [Methylobacteriaceae bacterium]